MNNKKHRKEKAASAGILVYIPSEVRLVQYHKSGELKGKHPDFDSSQYVKKHTTLTEPIVAPIVETAADEVKIHYDGANWWTSKMDTYVVESGHTLGDSLK